MGRSRVRVVGVGGHVVVPDMEKGSYKSPVCGETEYYSKKHISQALHNFRFFLRSAVVVYYIEGTYHLKTIIHNIMIQ